jgi:hypothetical protein
MSPEPEMTFYLLSIRGKLKPETLEEARAYPQLHGRRARQRGRRPRAGRRESHGVCAVRTERAEGRGVLILDIWNSMDGLNQFFANPHVQEQAQQIFAEPRPGGVDAGHRLPGLPPARAIGRNDRSVGIVARPGPHA